MRAVKIPHTCTDRKQLTYAQLILRMSTRGAPTVFEGRHLKTGSQIDEAELRPTPEYPEVPLLLEFAGHDRSGAGHRRSNDIHVLWSWQSEPGEWIELARVTSQGPEWVYHLRHFMLAHFNGAVPNEAEIAGRATRRILEVLDRELESLASDGRARAMSFLHDAFIARMLAA